MGFFCWFRLVSLLLAMRINSLKKGTHTTGVTSKQSKSQGHMWNKVVLTAFA